MHFVDSIQGDGLLFVPIMFSGMILFVSESHAITHNHWLGS